jgi:hypothetical protein
LFKRSEVILFYWQGGNVCCLNGWRWSLRDEEEEAQDSLPMHFTKLQHSLHIPTTLVLHCDGDDQGIADVLSFERRVHANQDTQCHEKR